MRSRGVVAAIALLMGSLLLTGTIGRAADTAYGTQSLQVTVTDGGYAVAPIVMTGRYQIVLENLSGQAVDLVLVRAPDGWTAEDVQESFATGGDLAITGEFTQSVLRSRQIPYLVFAGEATAHGRGYTTVDLDLGTWVVLSAATGAYSQFTSFNVVGAN